MAEFDLVALKYAPKWLLQQFLCTLNRMAYDENEFKFALRRRIIAAPAEVTSQLLKLLEESDQRRKLLLQVAQTVTEAHNNNKAIS